LRFCWVVTTIFAVSPMHAQSLCAGCAPAASAAQPSAAGRHNPGAATAVRDPALKELISDSDAVPPEFRADILLSLVESGKVVDAPLRKRLVNDAFAAAEAVQPTYGEGPFGRVGATREGRKAIALRMTKLDGMSLQSRAVRDMQGLSTARARAMFESISLPTLAPLTCKDDWVYDPGRLYSTLGDVVENDFRPSEITAGKRLAFLMPYVSNLESHAQIIPVAHLLSATKLTADELRQLAPAYEQAMLAVPQDELTFALISEDGGDYVRSVYGESSLFDAMSGLVAAMNRSAVPPGPLIRSFRAYLLQNFNGPRCDTTNDAGGKARAKDRLPGAVLSFNQAFGPLLAENGLTPIRAEELAKATVLPSAAFNPPPLSSESKLLTDAIQKLHTSLDESTKDGKVDSSWWGQLDDFLLRFYDWEQGDEAEVDYLHEKAQFYTALLGLIPKSPERFKVLESFIGFLDQHSYQNLGGAEWFLYPKVLLGGMYAADSHDEVLKAFLGSRDPVLSLYARLEVWREKPSNSGPPPPQ
jgi:hypothetical protein